MNDKKLFHYRMINMEYYMKFYVLYGVVNFYF